MTEEEAKTKWCPFVRLGHNWFPHGDPPSMNEGPECMASACMAWRWATVANPAWNPSTQQIAGWPPQNPYSQTPSGIASATDGFCGLAGQPR